MLGSITPLGERGRARRWPATVAFFVVGSTLGGLAIGGLSGALGVGLRAVLGTVDAAPTAGVVLVVLAAACLAGLATDAGVGPWKLPTVHRQVNEDWLARYRGWVVGLGFGAQLGFAVATIVTTATVYVALLAALLAGSLTAGLAIGAVFGITRALPLLAARRVTTAGQLRIQHLRMAQWAPRARGAALGAQGIGAVCAVGAVVVGSGAVT